MLKILLRKFLFIERFGNISLPFVNFAYYLRDIHPIYDSATASGKIIAE